MRLVPGPWLNRGASAQAAGKDAHCSLRPVVSLSREVSVEKVLSIYDESVASSKKVVKAAPIATSSTAPPKSTSRWRRSVQAMIATPARATSQLPREVESTSQAAEINWIARR